MTSYQINAGLTSLLREREGDDVRGEIDHLLFREVGLSLKASIHEELSKGSGIGTRRCQSMPKGYAAIACAVGAIIRDRLRRSRPEASADRITELLKELAEREEQSHRNEEKTRK